DRVRDRARSLLERERDAVRKAEDLDRLVGRKAPAVNESNLDHEREPRVDFRRAAHRRAVEFRSKISEHIPESSLDEHRPDRRETLRGGSDERRFVKGAKESVLVVPGDRARSRAGLESG